MRNISNKVALRPRTGLLADILATVGEDNIVILPLHAQGSAAAKAAATHAGPWKGGTPTPAFDSSDECTIAGTTGSIWGTSGYFTAAGDNYVVDKSDTGCAMMNLATAGGILIMHDMQIASMPSARETMYDMGGTSSSGGCFSGQIGTATSKTWMYLQYRSTTTGPSDIVSVDLTTAGVVGTGRFHTAHFWDAQNLTGTVYLNGAIATSGSGAFLAGGLPSPSPTVRGCTLFGKGNTTAPTASLLGANGSGAKMSNLVMIRFDEDRSGDIAEIATEAYQYWGELLRSLAR